MPIDQSLSWSILAFAALDLLLWAAFICVLIAVACVFIRGAVFLFCDWLADVVERWK